MPSLCGVLLRLLLSCVAVRAADGDCKATVLTETPLQVTWKNSPELRMFRFDAPEDLAIWLPFADVYLNVSSEYKDAIEIYRGENCSEVHRKADEGTSFFALPKWKYTSEEWLSPYESAVVGIRTDKPYSISLVMNYVNIFRLVGFALGVFTFFNAHHLVRNPVAFYGGGLTLGTLTSVLLLLIILYRFVPKRIFRLPFIFGWTFSAFLYYKAWENFGHIVTEYRNYVLVYLAVALFVSFAVCYRVGPPKDTRTLNLLQWFLQGLSLLVIYGTCQYKELSTTIIFLLLSSPVAKYVFGFSRTVVQKIAKFVRGPQPRRLLSEDEYRQEGVDFTRKELDNLRDYCRNSPGKDSWKNISRLSEPKKMSSFILGETDHISAHEMSSFLETLTDDDALSSDDEELENNADFSEDNGNLSEIKLRSL